MKISLYDYRINIRTAGPSQQDNLRSELYFAGCQKGRENPCPGCFNYELWYQETGTMVTPQDIINRLEEFNSVKSITIVGGEPTDQMEGLIDLTYELKKHGYHIIVITWHELCDILKEDEHIVNQYKKLFENIDMLVDGEYNERMRIYDDNHKNVLRSFIGSSNQLIHDFSEYTSENHVYHTYKITDDMKEIMINKDGGVDFVRN